MGSSVIIDSKEYNANEVRYVQCKNWEDYVKEVKKIRSIKETSDLYEMSSNVLFRGHSSKEWKLSSKLERSFLFDTSQMSHHNYSNSNYKKVVPQYYRDAAKQIFDKFKNLAHGVEGIDLNKSEEEIWALGRHYGLITPYLDWTLSPYIAAFFALINFFEKLEFSVSHQTIFPNEGSVYIWGLRQWKGLIVKDEFEITSIPRYFGSRLWAQAGIFTRLLSDEHLDIQSYLESRGIAHFLECYELPKSCADDAIADLKLMNISFSKLFPDLYGAAQEANLNEHLVVSSRIQKEIFNIQNDKEK